MGKIYRVGLSEIDDYYLVGLLTHGDDKTNIDSVRKEFAKRLKEKSCNHLLVMWNHTSNVHVKEVIEDELAERYKDYSGDFTLLPVLSHRYFETLESMDAIVTLTYAKCSEIRDQAMSKYIDIMEEYLEMSDYSLHYYENEGFDLEEDNPSNVVMIKPKKQLRTTMDVPTKIYKIDEFKSRRK